MFGAIAKTYYADKIGVKAEDMYVVSIMPCTAKKYEAQRPEMTASGVADVDAVLTVRELARMFRKPALTEGLPEEDYDDPLGISTGAAVIFGASGGVMEAALRTVYSGYRKDLGSPRFHRSARSTWYQRSRSRSGRH